MATSKLGTKIDALYRQEQKMREINAEIRKLNEKKSVLSEKYKKMEEELMSELNKNENLEGGIGKLAKAKIIRKKVPNVVNWDTLHKYVARNKAFDILQRKINTAAWKERMEEGKKIPGVEAVTIRTLSLTKVK